MTTGPPCKRHLGHTAAGLAHLEDEYRSEPPPFIYALLSVALNQSADLKRGPNVDSNKLN